MGAGLAIAGDDLGDGACFIRRSSRNVLYRRILARNVQIATAEGITQAIFPEGGLVLDQAALAQAEALVTELQAAGRC